MVVDFVRNNRQFLSKFLLVIIVFSALGYILTYEVEETDEGDPFDTLRQILENEETTEFKIGYVNTFFTNTIVVSFILLIVIQLTYDEDNQKKDTETKQSPITN